MIYLNIRTSEGVETVDHIDRKEFDKFSGYKKELRRLIREYHLCGMSVYASQRSTKDYWN